MSKAHRLNRAVQSVGQVLLPVETAISDTAVNAQHAVALMLQERRKAGAGADFGSKALALASEGANHLVAAANCFGSAHKELADLLAVEGFGPQCPVALPTAANAA